MADKTGVRPAPPAARPTDPAPTPPGPMKDAGIRCGNCDRRKGEHRLANFADGPAVGESVLICPTAVFRDWFVGVPP